MDRLHKWRPKKYSFVFVLIRPTSLVSTDKIQRKCSFRTRLVGLISTLSKQKSNLLVALYGIGLCTAVIGILRHLRLFGSNSIASKNGAEVLEDLH